MSYLGSPGQAPSVLSNLELSMEPGQVVGLLGESGCGKTTLAMTILGLLPDGAEVLGGEIVFGGTDLRRCSDAAMRGIRGRKIALIPQEPGIALNPVMRVGQQIVEVLRAHGSTGRRGNRARAAEALAQVGFRDVARIFEAYPHQLSGGQLQRVAIAQALVCGPQLVIADEPTASLDAVSRNEILALLEWLQKSSGVSILLISHQPAVLASLADRVLVMQRGRIIEAGETQQVLTAPKHPYAQALLNCAWDRRAYAAQG